MGKHFQNVNEFKTATEDVVIGEREREREKCFI